jgi:RNA polymerase sigma-70 factor (ECF subfamily)
VRQRGHGPEDAQDLTQEFLARLVHNNWLANLDPHTGRFRSFLLTVLHRFLINEYDRSRAAKRGGGKTFISLDQTEAEGRLALETATDESPEKIFDRRWALALLDRALMRLRVETYEAGKSRQFELLSPFLSRDARSGDYSTISAELGLSAGAVGVAVHRLRQRYREIVREEVKRTVADAAEAEAEMLHLFASLR